MRPLLPRIIRRIYAWLVGRRLAHVGHGTRVGLGFHVTDPKGVWIGSSCRVSDYVSLNAKRRTDKSPSLRIGDNTYLGRFLQINSLHSVVIEANVLIADRVWIGDEDHAVEPDRPIGLQPTFFRAPVLIREGCLIGVGSVIRPGVTVGRNAVVGANAVVTTDVPDFAIVAGVPAKVIGTTLKG